MEILWPVFLGSVLNWCLLIAFCVVAFLVVRKILRK